MFNLFLANLKMLVRNRQALFWSFFFPLTFTVIFGFFFGKGEVGAGTVILINRSNSQVAQNLDKALQDSSLFKIQKETDEDKSKDLLKKSKVSSIIVIPEGFGEQAPTATTKIKVIQDPGNSQANMVVNSFLDKYLTSVDFVIQNAKPIFSIDIENTTNRDLTYFDFILIGLVGMALMNSSIQGIAITMANYREDKILKRITTTPLAPWKFVLAEVFSHLILNFFQVTVILLIGIYGFGAHIYGSIFLIYLFSLLGALLFLAIGFAISSVSKTADAASGMAVAVTIPMMFLAGVFFPIDQLPKWLFSIVQYLPLAPLLRMIRQIALESISPFTNPINIIIVLVWVIIMLTVAIRRFRLAEE